MKIVSAEFVKSAFEKQHWINDGKPEIAFLGRSNVGKSSLLNTLLGRKNLARTSNTPGRTQSINYFEINKKFYFVDLPGYGFAKVSKKMRQEWGNMAEEYLGENPQLKLSIQLVDSRHDPTNLDKELFEWLTYYSKRHLVIATKADKLSNNKLFKSLATINKIMPNTDVIAFSAVTGKGKDSIWEYIEKVLDKKSE
ncbi:MAG: ribosome biogenesis GTP-binding protein YihA/YsxC [Pyrinomonadaceae bacterium]